MHTARAQKKTQRKTKAKVHTTAKRNHLLKAKIASQVDERRDRVKSIAKEHGKKIIDKVDVSQTLGGMRGIKGMLWETSLLDANEGIRFHGKSIPELQAVLPGAKRAAGLRRAQPLPEAMLWYLMSGEVPTDDEVNFLKDDLHKRAKLPAHVINTLKNFPKDMHPMTQFVAAITATQTESVFAKKYHTTSKKDLWDATFEDSLDVIAKAPIIAAHIYNNTYGNGTTPENDTSLDFTANFNRLIGFPANGKAKIPGYENEAESHDAFDEFMRLYFTIHTDHEGGNVSAHAIRLVGSALSDPYLSFAAGMAGLAGPLHGLANQEVLNWNLNLMQKIQSEGLEINQDTIRKLAWDTLNSGKVIPGYGHAVLRVADPRYTVQREFCLNNIPKDELFKLANTVYEVVPGVLTETGKVKNPWPNVDAMSGTPLYHYGLTETSFYTVLFGVSRAMGTLAERVNDSIIGHPLERPKSVNVELLNKLIAGSTETRQ